MNRFRMRTPFQEDNVSFVWQVSENDDMVPIRYAYIDPVVLLKWAKTTKKLIITRATVVVHEKRSVERNGET